MRAYEPFEESRFETKGTVTIKGEKIPFEAISEDFVFTDEAGEPEASMFSITYRKCDGGNRPVLFVWDGGPGCSMGPEAALFYSPWRVKNAAGSQFKPVNPPYELEENPNCPLDVCDIVLVDPVGTGYGKLLKPEAAPKYFSVEGDAKAMTTFIENWLTAYGRWNSPRYLAGTSYGTLRAARVVDELNGGAFRVNNIHRGIPVNGIILTGCGLSINETATSMLPEGRQPSVQFMRSMAATNCYHNQAADNIFAFCDEAETWAVEVLEPALNNGAGTEEEQAELAEKMSYYTGVPAEILLSVGLNIPDGSMYAGMALMMQGKDVGLYDGRMTLPKSETMGVADPTGDDPGMGTYEPAVIAAMSGLLKDRLGITFRRQWILQDFGINYQWDWSYPPTIMPEQLPAKDHNQCIVAAMRRNQEMKTMFASGLLDLCTWAGTVRYLVEKYDYPADRTFVKEYVAGHEIVNSDDAAKAFAEDLRTFIR